MSQFERGKSDATKKSELDEILDFLQVNKEDSFCDLGCGKGNTCIWASERMKCAIGIEDDRKRLSRANKNKNSRKRKHPNVQFIFGNYRTPEVLKNIKDCNVIFCVNTTDLGLYKWIEEVVRPESSFIKLGFPDYPVKKHSSVGDFFIMKSPFKLAKNRTEWVHSLLGSKSSTRELHNRIKHDCKPKYAEDEIQGIESEITGLHWVLKKYQINLK